MTLRPETDEASILTKAEVADLLRVSVRTIDRYVADGKLVPLHTPSGRLRFRRDDVEAGLAGDAA